VAIDYHRLCRQLGYGYGWLLESIADWIFAYYAIVKESRPINPDDGSFKNAEQIVDHICEHVNIAHMRLTKEEPTYMRNNGNGGQIGNHAKVIIADDSTFYIGSDNIYGAGLAEHGLVVDDESKTQEFVERYWNDLWEQAKGENNAGLVTGKDGPCRWRNHYEAMNWQINN
jgi:phosphatidylserine/phosphatidylglycerophosphate/cardiolipin synthase-like enzyme